MTARTIHIETALPTNADAVWAAMKHPASFLYVTRGVVGFPALAGRTTPIRAGEIVTGWVVAFHLLPIHRHTIDVIAVDETTRSIVSHEHGGVLRRWDHTLRVDPTGDMTCTYSDTVTIEAGALTRFVALTAISLYRYRQRRWRLLVRRHLLPDDEATMGRYRRRHEHSGPLSTGPLLDSTAVALVSTIGPKGEPQVAPIWFLWRDDSVHFSLVDGRQKLRNLRGDPRASVVIVDPADPTRYLELRGTVALVDDPDCSLERAVAIKYRGEHVDIEPPGTARFAATLAVERVTSQSGH